MGFTDVLYAELILQYAGWVKDTWKLNSVLLVVDTLPRAGSPISVLILTELKYNLEVIWQKYTEGIIYADLDLWSLYSFTFILDRYVL